MLHRHVAYGSISSSQARPSAKARKFAYGGEYKKEKGRPVSSFQRTLASGPCQATSWCAIAYSVDSSGRGSVAQRLANSPEARAWSCCLTSTKEPSFSHTITRGSLAASQLVSTSACQLSPVGSFAGGRFARRLPGRSPVERRGAMNRAVLLTADKPLRTGGVLTSWDALKHRPAVHGLWRFEALFEKGLLRLVEEVGGHGSEREGEAVRERVRPLLGRPLGEPHADELLLDLGTTVVDHEADDRGEGHHRLHGEAGRQVDGAHEDADGGGPEEGARKLKPLRPREAGLDPPLAGVRERNAHEALVSTPRQHEQGSGWDTQRLQPLVELLERPQVPGDGPDGVVARDAHTVLILPWAAITSRSPAANAGR